MRKSLLLSGIVALCLAGLLFVVIPISGVAVYNPWMDINDDGKIDVRDIASVSKLFGTLGEPINKSSLVYDSGWIDYTNTWGEYCFITHNLNSDLRNLIVEARGRTIGWNRTYGGAYADIAYSMLRTSERGFILCGKKSNANTTQAWLFKVDQAGNLLWERTYGNSGVDVAWSLIQTSDGGYAMAGYTWTLSGSGQGWLIKTDASGNMQWSKNYGGGNHDFTWSLVQTYDGGYALAGYSWSYGVNGDAWLIKADSSGNLVWSKTYGGNGFDRFLSVIQVGTGFALGGYTNSTGAGRFDAWWIRTDSAGNSVWTQTYGGTGDDTANSLIQTSDGGYALAGYTDSFDPLGAAWLIKTDQFGTKQWDMTYDNNGETASAESVMETREHGFALVGMANGGFGKATEVFLVKTDWFGNKQWSKTYGGSGWDWAYSFVQTYDGGFALVGYTESYGPSSDAWLIRTNIEGGLAWQTTTLNAIMVEKDGGPGLPTDWNHIRVQVWRNKSVP